MPKPTSKRPCCQLLRKFAQQTDKLQDPVAVAQLLEVLSRECVLLRTFGESRVGIDAANLNCFLHVSPESENLISEIGKTVAVNLDLQQKFYLLLAAVNEILSKNANSQQITEYILPLLAELREGERKFGAVLAETKSRLDSSGNILDHVNTLTGHPLLMQSQANDGISDPKAVNLPTDHPDAQQKAEELKLQPTPEKVNQLTLGISNAPKFRPIGG